MTGLPSSKRTTASMQKRLNKSQLKKPHNSYTYLIDDIIDKKEVGQISTKPQNAKALKDFDILLLVVRPGQEVLHPTMGLEDMERC